MLEPQEFPSPLAPPTPSNPPVALPKPVVATFSGSDGDLASAPAQPPAPDTTADSIPPERLWPDRHSAKRDTRLDLVIEAFAADPSFFAFVARLAAKPQGRRDDAVRTCRFWLNNLTAVERGKVVKWHKQGLPDREIAALAGTARETLVRDDGYKAFKHGIPDTPQTPAAKFRGRVRSRIEPTPKSYGVDDEGDPED
jgi:hypothetical protein